MGIFVLVQQLPMELRTNPLLWTGVGVAAAISVALTVLKGRSRVRTERERPLAEI
jgi:hypothetical protein